MKGFLYVITLLAILSHSSLSRAEDPIWDWVRDGETGRLESYLEDHDVNGRYGGSGTTLLVHSILHGHAATTDWLIGKGADVNLPVGAMSPLMHASGMDDLKKVSILIESGANIEAMDTVGNTALFYAAGNGNLKIIKFLAKHGADISHENHTWQTAYDMAVRQGRSEAANYLRTLYERSLPDLLDGPYIRWTGKRTIKAFYLLHDSRSQITRRPKSKFKSGSDPALIKGFAGDTLEYMVRSRKEVPGDEIEDVNKIVVVGDIHGGYDSLVLFLRNNGIIDSSHDWSWGDGHLVFVGDIFDRGEKVTEVLWLIYQLEDQACASGGAVHLILGNHEIMVLSGNMNYVHDKYLLMTSRLNIEYSALFGYRSVLGQWLRTRNTILRINGNLFVHAGLSAEIRASGLTMNEINDHVRFFLRHPERVFNDEVSRHSLMGPQGPFWYRGFLEDNHQYRHLSDEEFGNILEYFNARAVFVGHTNVKQVTSIYNDRVFAIDVPFYTYGYPIKGLLLEGNGIFVLNSNADKNQIR